MRKGIADGLETRDLPNRVMPVESYRSPASCYVESQCRQLAVASGNSIDNCRPDKGGGKKGRQCQWSRPMGAACGHADRAVFGVLPEDALLNQQRAAPGGNSLNAARGITTKEQRRRWDVRPESYLPVRDHEAA